MKIVIATDTYPPHVNGAASFTYRLGQTLGKRGHTVLVIAPSRSVHNEDWQDGAVRVVGIRSLPLYVNNSRLAMPMVASDVIAKAVRSFTPDVAHVQSHFFLSRAVAEIAQRQKIPVVATNHFMPENLTHYVGFSPVIEQYLADLLWRQCIWFFRSVDAVTTPTKTAAKLLADHGLQKPATAISNGIDLERFHPSEPSDVIRNKYHLPNKPTALFVGRLDKEKHIDVLLRAAVLAVRQLDMHLIIAGSDKGSQARRLRQLAGNLAITDHVTFTGFVPSDDLPELYRCAQVFLMASIAELQSLATMEAMASGLPVIAANAMALPELVTPNKNGWLFEPGDYMSLSGYLVQILSDLPNAQRMCQASRQRMAPHAQDLVIEQFEKTYTATIRSAA